VGRRSAVGQVSRQPAFDVLGLGSFPSELN